MTKRVVRRVKKPKKLVTSMGEERGDNEAEKWVDLILDKPKTKAIDMEKVNKEVLDYLDRQRSRINQLHNELNKVWAVYTKDPKRIVKAIRLAEQEEEECQ